MAEIKLMLSLMLTLLTSILAKQPHIILIVADDYGWDDIGYHGNKEVRTPSMDKLAAEGIKLENHYVQPLCTPTRSQLLSGRYQIHTGLQHFLLYPCQRNGLPLEESTIADQLKPLGYATHIIGKWHLGLYKKEYTPLYRGFDSHFGFLTGGIDYYNHSFCLLGKCAADFQYNGKPTLEFRGQYSTKLFTTEAQKIIHSHNKDQPLFMYLAYNAPHHPMQVPQHYIEKFKHIEDETRRIYLAMVYAMDEGIGNITTSLKQSNMWDDSLIIFISDNGGAKPFGARNFPLRGQKGDHWEGGIRGIGFLAGQYIKRKGEINHQLLHVSDWYPTILNLAGGKVSSVRGLDGFDQWKTITENSSNPRHEILINIDELTPRKGKTISKFFDTGVRSALRHGDWKILTGEPVLDWVAGYKSETKNVFEKDVISLQSHFWKLLDHVFDWIKTWMQAREGYSSCQLDKENIKNVYLFNIAQDPGETNDLSAQHPEIVNQLLKRLAYYNSTAVPVRFPEQDIECDPSKQGGFWGPWIEE